MIVEALAFGTPVVATGVGGVPAAFGDTGVALLVPPADKDRLVSAVRDVVSDRVACDHRTELGLALARRLTLEAESERVARFIARGA